MSLQKQLYDKLLESIHLSGSEKFLLCSTPIDWDWPFAQEGYINKSEYDFVGYMPQPVEEDKLYYTPSDKEVFQAYSTVINSVNPTRSDHYHQELSDIDNQITAAKAKLDENKAYMEEAKKGAQNQVGFKEKDWMESSGWKGILDASRKALQALLDDKNDLIENWDNPRKEALDAINRKAEENPSQGYAKMMNRGEIYIYPNFRVDKNGQEWARQVRTGRIGTPTQILLNMHTNQQSKVRPNFAENLGFNPFLNFGIRMLVPGGRLIPDILFDNSDTEGQEEEETKLSIKYQAITTVSVRPDPGWYKSGYLSKIGRDNYWKEPSDSTETMLGTNGILHSVIVGFVAIYGPSYSIQMSKSALENAKHATEFNNDFNISLPPFINGRVPISGHSEAVNDLKPTSLASSFLNDSLIIESNTEYPQIIGVIIDRPHQC